MISHRLEQSILASGLPGALVTQRVERVNKPAGLAISKRKSLANRMHAGRIKTYNVDCLNGLRGVRVTRIVELGNAKEPGWYLLQTVISVTRAYSKQNHAAARVAPPTAHYQIGPTGQLVLRIVELASVVGHG